MPTAFETWSEFAPHAPVLTAPEEFNVFVSHGSIKHVWMVNLCDALRNRGFKLFLDHRALAQDDRAIALNRSQVGLIVWSSAAADADWMQQSFDLMTQRAASGSFDVVIARTDRSVIPGYVGATRVVDFALYAAGPGGGEALRLLFAVAGRTPSPEIEAFAAKQDAAAGAFMARLKTVGKEAAPEALLAQGGAWETSSAVASAAAERLVTVGDNDAALKALDTVRQRFSDALRPRQVQALAHARRGKVDDLNAAQSILTSLYDAGVRDPETVGIYARTFMDHYNATGNAASLRRSRDLYAEAFERAPDDGYVGINAAAKSVFLQTPEDLKKGLKYASDLQSRIGRKAVDDYWDSATVAECHLILGEYDEAAEVYRQAVAMDPGETASHTSTWKQASKLMAILRTPANAVDKIRDAFGNPPSAPTLDVSEEIRFALVMYGGVSLAIYINGVAQEFLRLVRATAADPSDLNQPLLSRRDPKALKDPAEPKDGTRPDYLEGTELVYRRAAQLLGNERDEVKRPVTDDSPIRARFVVDILSGTSAGGINAIFLAKALANHQSIDQLRQLWIDEGAIESLINDSQSVAGLNGLAAEKPPTSLLNGRRMYRKLLDAFDCMDKKPASQRSPFVDELDLFVTTTDIRGLPVFLRLADDVVPELRHRNVFRFRYSDGFSSDAANDFTKDTNPFLAYAARCTSSFPFAFPPMKLTDIGEVLGRTPDREKDSDSGGDADKWRRFFPSYAAPTSGPSAAPEVYDFTNRAFGDGGYLDNKPFGHATDMLQSRRGGTAVQRKLVFIEPSPEHPVLGAPPSERPNVIENVNAALSLARYETIRDDLERVRARNRLIERVGSIVGGMEDDVRAVTMGTPTIRPNFGDLDLSEMIRLHGVAYGGYHRLKVQGVTNELARLLSRLLQYDDRSDEFVAIRYLIRAWRETKFVAYVPTQPGASGPSGAAAASMETENAFLARFDLAYRLRRLEFVITKIDQLSCIDRTTKELFTQRNAGATPDAQGDRDAFRAELAQLRGELRAVYEPLRRGRDELQTRGTANPIAAQLQTLELDQKDLHELLKPPTDFERLGGARAALTKSGRTAAIDALSSAIATHIARLTEAASMRCAWVLDIPLTVTQTLTQAPRAIGNNRYAAVAVDFVRHYYEAYERYDFISYPILQSADVGEETNAVAVVRISPEDAPSLIDERKTTRRKLAGTKFMHFGAFLDQGWRKNDILWGRLDAAERILSTILSPNHPKMAELLEQAQLAILEEEHRKSDQDQLSQLLVESLMAQISSDKGEAALRELAKPEMGSDINPKLQALLRSNLSPERLLAFYRDSYEVNANLNPKKAVQSLARAVRVVGGMLEQLSEDTQIGASPTTWFSRIARTFWGLVEVAVPGSLPNLIVKHWLSLLYLFAVLLIVGETLLSDSAQFGWTALAITVAAHIALAMVGRVMRGKQPWSRLASAAAAVAVALILGAGAFSLWNPMVRAALWHEIKALFG